MGKAPPWPTSHCPSPSPRDCPPASRPCPGVGEREPLVGRVPAPGAALPGGGVRGGARHLHAVVVGALPVEVAAVVVDAAVVQGAEAHEAVLQGVVPLLVHVVVPNHVLLAREPLPGEGQVGRSLSFQQARGARARRQPQGSRVSL